MKTSHCIQAFKRTEIIPNAYLCKYNTYRNLSFKLRIRAKILKYGIHFFHFILKNVNFKKPLLHLQASLHLSLYVRIRFV